MIKSMTGYGRAQSESGSKRISIEIRSLNSKQLDLSTRLPSVYREKELEIRNIVSDVLERGKIDVNLGIDCMEEQSGATINGKLVKQYFEQLKSISGELGIQVSELSMQAILRFPDALKVQKEELDENEWAIIVDILHKALDEIDNSRTQEGRMLESEIKKHVEFIIGFLKSIEPFEQERIDFVRKKLDNSIAEYLNKEQIDENRFEQELIYYIEKLDITEEKVRLETHCKLFLETMGDSQSPGRKLGFIAQEIGREINTIGSKANHAGIQRVVVQMKDALEKIKEQSLNVL